MDWNLANMTISLVGAIGTLAGTYIAWVQIRRRSSRRQPPATLTAGQSVVPAVQRVGGAYNAYISYADSDADAAEWVADEMESRGRRVFLATSIGLGLLRNAEKERAMANSANGIVVFSRTTLSQPDIRDEYAGQVDRVHSAGGRLVPVLVEQAELPMWLKIREPLDLIDRNDAQARLDKLAEAIK
jgi:hypothetical protein